MAKDVWVNIWDGHFKVWGFDLFQDNNGGNCELTLYWGKIGLPMEQLTQKKKPFGCYADAYDYIMDKIKTRGAHGYRRMPNHIYFPYTYEEKPLSELVQYIETSAKGGSQ